MKHRLHVPLNRQQLELMDRTIAQGLAPDRAALLRLALREFGALHRAPGVNQQPAPTPLKEAS
jgi:hypothetical protein